MINFRPLASAKLKDKNKALIYRSSELIKLNNEEIKHITDTLSIGSYIDLRTTDEILKRGKPELLMASLTWKSFPIEDNNHYFRTKNDPDFYDYYDSYKCLLELNKASIKALLEDLSLSSDKSIIIACFAGKDRTGIISIILLMSMAFTTSDIVEDYVESGKFLLSGIDYFESNWLSKNMGRAAYQKRLTPHPDTAKLLIDYINETYGGIQGYLEDIRLDFKPYHIMLTKLRSFFK
jgi:protein tyrosine/serine phosphatase